jgi:TonB family protein
MRNAVIATFAMGIAIAGSSFALAQPDSIQVEGSRTTVSSWSTAVAQDIQEQVRYPRSIGRDSTPTGTAVVRFNRGEDGKPINIVLQRSSGTSSLNHAAMAAVAQMDAIAPLPVNMASSKPIEAHIIFADSQDSLNQQVRQLNHEAVLAAKSGAKDEAIALNVGFRVAG